MNMPQSAGWDTTTTTAELWPTTPGTTQRRQSSRQTYGAEALAKFMARELSPILWRGSSRQFHGARALANFPLRCPRPVPTTPLTQAGLHLGLPNTDTSHYATWRHLAAPASAVHTCTAFEVSRHLHVVKQFSFGARLVLWDLL